MAQASWTASHVAAWDFFAGAQVRLVSDNLKTGIVKANLYDPLVNGAYGEMAEHYGCLVDLARALKPKDKPRVERMVQYGRDSFWWGRSFASVADMQARALDWCTQVAGQRPHRGLDGARPLAVFETVEAPGLLPLPDKRFEVARWVSPKVAPDCHVQVDKVLYSVPWAHIGARIDTKVTERVVAIHVAGCWSRPGPGSLGAGAPMRRTTRRRRSRSSPATRSGAAARPPTSARMSPSWSPGCLRCRLCIGSAQPRVRRHCGPGTDLPHRARDPRCRLMTSSSYLLDSGGRSSGRWGSSPTSSIGSPWQPAIVADHGVAQYPQAFDLYLDRVTWLQQPRGLTCVADAGWGSGRE